MISLTLRRNEVDSDQFDLELVAGYEGQEEAYNVTLVFSGMRNARLPELTPYFYLGELEIEDLSRDQVEGVRYRAKDHAMSAFQVYCADVKVKVERCSPVGE